MRARPMAEDTLAAAIPARPRTRIQATSGWAALDLAELWRYRDLILILAGRDVKLRYKQTFLGVTWVVVKPLLAAVIFAVIFGRLAHVPSDGVPYVIFAFASLLGWNYFSEAATRAAGSLVGQAPLITKVYFPRLVVPLASTLGVLVDLAVSLGALAVLMAFYRIWPGPRVAILFAFLVLITLVAWGVGLWLSALSVYYRDFVYALPFLIQVWMYVTPVVFPASLVPARWRWLLALNPLASWVEGVRWAALGRGTLDWRMAWASGAVTLVLLVSGLFYFRRVERVFSDVI